MPTESSVFESGGHQVTVGKNLSQWDSGFDLSVRNSMGTAGWGNAK